jgi:hypothetical protein
MTRFLFRTIDFGASVVFMVFCAKVFSAHLFEDIRRGVSRRADPPELAKSWAQTPAE